MTSIRPLPWEAMTPALRDAIAAGQHGRAIGDPNPIRQWAHRPAVATAWVRLLCELHDNAVLDERLRELVRLRIASFTQCSACQLSRKSDSVTEHDLDCLDGSREEFSNRERAALDFADVFSVNHLDINPTHLVALRAQFGDEEIVELAMFCALMTAGGKLGHVLSTWAPDEVGAP